MTTKAMDYFAARRRARGAKAMMREIRDQILKQTAKTHVDAAKEITKAFERNP